MRTKLITLVAALGIAVTSGVLVAAPASATPASSTSSVSTRATAGHQVPSLHRFLKGRTDLTLDPAAAGALRSLGVSVSPVLALARGSVISFLVVGNPKDGTIEHIGGLLLKAGHTRLYLTDYTIDLNRGVLSGRVDFRQRADLFTLGAATPKGVTLALTAGAASVLNSTFGVTAFTEGLVIGYGNPVLR